MNWAAPVSLVDGVARLALLAALIGSPWVFGSVETGARRCLCAVSVVLLLAAVVRQIVLPRRLPIVALSVLFTGVLLGVLQLMPLGRDALDVLTPAGSRIIQDLDDAQPSPDAAVASRLGLGPKGDRRPITLYPASTRQDLATLSLGLGYFVLGAIFFAGPRAKVALCATMAAVGAAVAFFGIVQQLTWNGLLYWRIPLEGGGSPFGPFVNRNNAGGFLILCLAGSVGLLVWATGRRPRDEPPRHAHDPSPRSMVHRVHDALLQAVARCDAPRLLAASLAACIAAGILCSLSRGSVIAMLGAATVTLLVALGIGKHRIRLWGVAVVVAAGLAMVAWVGMTGRVQSRLATLGERQTIEEGRLPLWRDSLQAVADFWPVGSGLGTYRYVYGLYQQQPEVGWAYHAENQYLEALIDGGILGLALPLVFMVLVALAIGRSLRDADLRNFALGVAGTFALTGQAIHSIFDFDLVVPANLVLFALLCGSILAPNGTVATEASKRGVACSRWLAVGPTAIVLAIAMWGYRETRRLDTLAIATRAAVLTERYEARTPVDVAAARDNLAAALAERPDDAEGHLRMANLWIDSYQLQALEQLRKEAAPHVKDTDLSEFTTTTVLHRRAHEFDQGHSDDLDKLRSEPAVRDNLLPALGHLLQARRACPLLPDVELKIARLAFLVDSPGCDRGPLDRARQLAPADCQLLYHCGRLELQAGRRSRAMDCWRRCVTLDPSYLGATLRRASEFLSPVEIAQQLAPDSPSILIEMGVRHFGGKEYDEARRVLGHRLEGIASTTTLSAADRHHLHAAALGFQGSSGEAILEYQQAIDLRPQAADWRYELALLLKRQDRMAEAYRQAVLCARMQPGNADYRALLQAIHSSSPE